MNIPMIDRKSIALQRITLKNLNPNMSNVLVVGIIIGKTKPRKFLDTKCPVPSFKAVWNFTIRDSKSEYITVSYWEASETIYQANDQYRTGDVGKYATKIIKFTFSQ